MTKPEFTPAPWDARYIGLRHRDSPDMGGKPSRHSYEYRIDFYSAIDMDFEEGKANANLISAAPELYSALSDLLLSVEVPPTDISVWYELSAVDFIENAKQALAKARGELEW